MIVITKYNIELTLYKLLLKLWHGFCPSQWAEEVFHTTRKWQNTTISISPPSHCSIHLDNQNSNNLHEVFLYLLDFQIFSNCLYGLTNLNWIFEYLQFQVLFHFIPNIDGYEENDIRNRIYFVVWFSNNLVALYLYITSFSLCPL